MDRTLLRRIDRYAERIQAAMAEGAASALAPTLYRLLREAIETGEVPTPAAFAPVADGAVGAATAGLALDDVLAGLAAAISAGWTAALDVLPEPQRPLLLSATPATLGCLAAATSVASSAYLDERLHLAAAVQAAEWALVDAVLAGRPTAAAAARAGRELAGAYGVLLLQGPVAREHLRPFEDAISRLGDGGALWRLTAGGANILVPVEGAHAGAWLDGADALLDHLSAAGGAAPLVAAVAWGEGPSGVAAAGDDAIQVLRLVTGLGRPPGLYRLDDVLLEAALSGTATGPAARLSSILAPLDAAGGPELLATLEAYLAHDADRRATAAALHVHPNTLDYRLRRIGELTGRPPGTARGLQVLGAALTLRRVGRIAAAGRTVASG